MRPCVACGRQVPDKIDLCPRCGAPLARLTLAERLAKRHGQYLQRCGDGDAASETQGRLSGPEQPPTQPTLVGEFIWYVHPQYDACFYLGNVVSVSQDGLMMCVEDKWKNTSFTYIEGLWTRIGRSCYCA
jgi:hypothetical protein